jgi:exopolyphosphatase/guanosine-5'-triphosphate,3'-diphosphate pyrophosphatase
MASSRPSTGGRFVTESQILAAIDVGTNAVRLEMARPLPDGSLEIVHQERDPVRPGEGLFTTGAMPKEAADRLLATLRRYAALCRRHKARVRAVATSAVREARNRAEIVERARKEAGLNLEVISGREEARLICLGVLHGAAANARSMVIDIGGGSTEVATAIGEQPTNLWSLSAGAVRLTELFDAGAGVTAKKLQLLRAYAGEVIEETIPRKLTGYPHTALGSSGTVRSIVGFAAAEGTGHATTRQITRAVDALAALGVEERRRRFDPRRGDIIVAGAVILEALAKHLNLAAIVAVERGLRHGVLVDLLRGQSGAVDHSLPGAARALGRRFYFDEPHADQVARLALSLFDELASVHQLPAAVRPYLEAAALLHDIGNAVSYQKHHRHTQYLIQNADIPGLADRERELVARIARYHRRSAPEVNHAGMVGLTLTEARTVRKLASLLRVADALDRSHHQPIQKLRARRRGRDIVLRLVAKVPIDLELWDVAHEAGLFRTVFQHTLRWEVARA